VDRNCQKPLYTKSSNTCKTPQETIESKLEKRTKGVYGAPGGKRLVAFIDDLNMPAKSQFGFMPPLELLKLWADNGFWYAGLGGAAACLLGSRLRCSCCVFARLRLPASKQSKAPLPVCALLFTPATRYS
jgi:hypothetical protein